MAFESVKPAGQQNWSAADVFTAVRIPLAILFVAIPETTWRLVILWCAGITDFADGLIARRWGGSRLGAFLDPVADKVFTGCAFVVVFFEGPLTLLEILAVLARDIAVTLAFVATVVFRRPSAIPARMGGKLVTILQLLTLLAFLLSSPLLRPVAWLTGAVAIYAILDYLFAARRSARLL